MKPCACPSGNEHTRVEHRGLGRIRRHEIVIERRGVVFDDVELPRIELRGITKVYPAVVANKNVSLTAMPGEIHAVLGENGAGKSTLMKIIYGVVKPDAGEMLWEGRPVAFQ